MVFWVTAKSFLPGDVGTIHTHLGECGPPSPISLPKMVLRLRVKGGQRHYGTVTGKEVEHT